MSLYLFGSAMESSLGQITIHLGGLLIHLMVRGHLYSGVGVLDVARRGLRVDFLLFLLSLQWFSRKRSHKDIFLGVIASKWEIASFSFAHSTHFLTSGLLSNA